MRTAPCTANWIPPRPVPAKATWLPRLPGLREAGLTATLAVVLSWTMAEVTLLLLG